MKLMILQNRKRQASTFLGAIILITQFNFSFCNNKSEKKLIVSINDFTFKLYKQFVKEQVNAAIISPYSVSVALTMLFMGSKGETSEELRKTLGFKAAGLTSAQVMELYTTLLKKQNAENQQVELTVANSFWITKQFTIVPAFKTMLKEQFFSPSDVVNFHHSTALITINNWIRKSTKGKIPNMFYKLDPNTRLLLVSANYFKGKWHTSFHKTKTKHKVFHNVYSNSRKEVAMMNRVDVFNYSRSESLQSQLIEIPYKGYEYSMIIIFPSKNNGLKDIEMKINSVILNEAIRKKTRKKLNLFFPRLNLTSDYLPISKDLTSLGIQSAFGANADFSQITGLKNIHVTEVFHKVSCEVDEEGTEDATSTVIETKHRNDYSTLKVDHPFMFVIRNMKNGLILFIGRVYEL